MLRKTSAPLERRTTETNMQAENWGRKGSWAFREQDRAPGSARALRRERPECSREVEEAGGRATRARRALEALGARSPTLSEVPQEDLYRC